MAATDKDTIYIDIDDEITGIIDKLKVSDGKVVALVLPKRAAVFQSIVNMKLLKRAADASKKHLVLITSEAGLLPLAGAAGVHVAKTLTSKPEIPTGPGEIDDAEETVQEDADDVEEVDPTKPVGALAGPPPAGNDVETLVMDDEDLPPEADAKPAGAKDFTPKGKKNKKFKIPDFNRFRLLLAGGILLLILLIIGFVFAGSVLPKAIINIKTDAVAVDANVDLNLSTTATKLNPDDNTVPAKVDQQQKTYTQAVPTTGQKNNGNKASGSVTVTNCSDNDTVIPAGTGFSSGGNTYISQSAVGVPASNFNSSGHCKNDGKASVDIVAQNGGSAYNLPSGAAFTVASGGGQLSGQGSSITGGTDNIVQTVNQNDITNAKAKIAAAGDAEMKNTLNSQLKQENYFAVVATYSAGTPTVTTSANVGEVASSVTVTEAITYTMFGAKQSDLSTLVKNNIKDQIDTSKQNILDDGVNSATFNVENLTATSAKIAMTTKAAVGPDLDVDSLRAQAAGKKPGAVKSDIGNNPDVTDVEVKLSPFWVSSVPKKASRITVNIAKPTPAAKANNSNGNNP